MQDALYSSSTVILVLACITVFACITACTTREDGFYGCDAIAIPCCRDGVVRNKECTPDGLKCPAGFEEGSCGQTTSQTAAPDAEDADMEAPCTDPRKPGDGKQPGDTCWAPPESYCSDTEDTSLITGACAPDGGACCVFSTHCVRCEWSECPHPCDATTSDWTPSDDDAFCGLDPEIGFPAGCPQTGTAWAERATECDTLRPDPSATVCYDGM